MTIEAIGSVAVGLVIGWILPIVRKRSPVALLTSSLEATIVVAWVAITIGLQAGATAAAGMVVAATIHVIWRVHLASRSTGRGLEPQP